jgi:hypothetical protein
MILIYTSYINARITYITRFIFGDVLKTSCELTTHLDEFCQYDGPKINYSFEELDAITILPNSFLKKTGIFDIEVGVNWINEVPVLFHECADVPLPFDPFAAAFYLITRYEEYTITDRDMHGRFMAASSLAYRNHFLEMPVIDIWAHMIRDVIQKHYPSYLFPEKEFTFIPTIDVDVAYAYKGRSLLRNMGAVVKSGLNIQDQLRRIQTWLGSVQDPYNTFETIDSSHKRWNLSPIFFVQVGKHGKFDKNLAPHHPLMKNLVSKLANEARIGVHPSCQSHLNKEMVKEEQETLAAITGGDITKSRQHFLRMALPDTYNVLEQCGIQEDYSMGYADWVGFRAGTCTPFKFYNLLDERETNLVIVPFGVMDGTLKRYMGLDPHTAITKIKDIVQSIRAVNGTMVTIWHNHSFSGIDEWSAWKTFYNEALESIVVKER